MGGPHKADSPGEGKTNAMILPLSTERGHKRRTQEGCLSARKSKLLRELAEQRGLIKKKIIPAAKKKKKNITKTSRISMKEREEKHKHGFWFVRGR